LADGLERPRVDRAILPSEYFDHLVGNAWVRPQAANDVERRVGDLGNMNHRPRATGGARMDS
jgi:hypothetical protein